MSANTDPGKNSAKDGACPICKAAAAGAYRPFCSKRCADIDLHRWLSGSYAIPAVEADDDQEPSDEKE
jgi:hypothetical protein